MAPGDREGAARGACGHQGTRDGTQTDRRADRGALRIASLFSGTGALDLAAMDVYGGNVVWHSQYEPPDKHGKPDLNQYAAKILARHWPGVPNLGDITAICWACVLAEHGPIDVLTGGFPCFPAGTLITTSTGLVPIEEIAVGDQVLTHNRRWRPVTQTMSRQADHRIAVKAMGAPTITTTDEHPFYALRTRDAAQPEWVKAGELAAGMYLAQPLDEDSDATEVSEQDLVSAYLVGRWLGDGWTVTHKRTSKVPQGQRGSRVNSFARRIHWCCATGETDELEKVFAAAGISPTRVNDRTVVKYVMQSTKWADLLDEYGKYAHGKRIPEATHHLPRPVQAAILRGWLDSDGHTRADGSVGGTTVSRALALGLARIARYVHGKPVSVHEAPSRGTSVIEGRTVNSRAQWDIRISPGPSKRGFTSGGFAWVPVRSVVRTTNEQRVYNISVQDDESYVAESVVVHNCTDVSSAGQRAGLLEGTRSGLWNHMARAISVLRPRLVVIENVQGLLSAPADRGLELDAEAVDEEAEAGRILRALGAVLGDLATLGFDAEWVRVAASEVGAAHGRKRVFIVAWPAAADAADLGHERGRGARRWGDRPADCGISAAHTCGARLEVGGVEPARHERQAAERGCGESPADADGAGLPGHGELPIGRHALQGGVRADAHGCHPAAADAAGDTGRVEHGDRRAAADADDFRRRADVLDLRPGQPDVDWGDYGPAIRRHERVFGRPAPWPTDALGRLSPVFTEWLMGYPDGWVTCTPGLNRNAMLRALGNGIVRLQGTVALLYLHSRLPEFARLPLTATAAP